MKRQSMLGARLCTHGIQRLRYLHINFMATFVPDRNGFTNRGRGPNIIDVGLVVRHMARCTTASNPYLTNQTIILHNERAVQIKFLLVLPRCSCC